MNDNRERDRSPVSDLVKQPDCEEELIFKVHITTHTEREIEVQ